MMATIDDTAARPTRPFLGLDYDVLTLDEVAGQLDARPADAPFGYLVTPNVDHVVRLHDDQSDDRETIWAAYRAARWCTCDSRILAALAKSRGIELPIAPGRLRVSQVGKLGMSYCY